MILHGYWRSSSSYRLRIALNLKGLAYAQAPVHLPRGEHRAADFLALNPQGRVPALTHDDGTVLVQSPAIIEYLEERFPDPPLLPKDPLARARVRAAAAIVGADVHALHNIGPLNMLRREFGLGEDQVSAWLARWIGDGLAAYEAAIPGGPFSFGAEPGLADAYLLPAIYAARRFAVPLDAMPKIRAAEDAAADHPAFAAAHPSRQPDAE